MSGHTLFSTLKARTRIAQELRLNKGSDAIDLADAVFELLVTTEGLVEAILDERMQRAADRNAIRAHAERTKLYDQDNTKENA